MPRASHNRETYAKLASVFKAHFEWSSEKDSSHISVVDLLSSGSSAQASAPVVTNSGEPLEGTRLSRRRWRRLEELAVFPIT